jgi:RNA polymerase sigma-70 factor (ECF subfamily)
MVKKTLKVKEADDSRLVKIILNKNPEMYREVVKRYQKKLFVYLYHLVGSREETDDILQNVFLKVYGSLKNFDTRKKFSSWIYRIAHNEAVNFLKRKSQKKFISWEDILGSGDKIQISGKEKSPLDSWIEKELKMEVRKAVNKLSDEYREVLILRYFLDKSYGEIGAILGKPVNTVGTLINRAKKKLLLIINKSWK